MGYALFLSADSWLWRKQKWAYPQIETTGMSPNHLIIHLGTEYLSNVLNHVVLMINQLQELREHGREKRTTQKNHGAVTASHLPSFPEMVSLLHIQSGTLIKFDNRDQNKLLSNQTSS